MEYTFTKEEIKQELFERVKDNADTKEEFEVMSELIPDMAGVIFDKVTFYDEERGVLVIKEEDALGLLANLFIDIITAQSM